MAGSNSETDSFDYEKRQNNLSQTLKKCDAEPERKEDIVDKVSNNVGEASGSQGAVGKVKSNENSGGTKDKTDASLNPMSFIALHRRNKKRKHRSYRSKVIDSSSSGDDTTAANSKGVTSGTSKYNSSMVNKQYRSNYTVSPDKLPCTGPAPPPPEIVPPCPTNESNPYTSKESPESLSMKIEGEDIDISCEITAPPSSSNSSVPITSTSTSVSASSISSISSINPSLPVTIFATSVGPSPRDGSPVGSTTPASQILVLQNQGSDPLSSLPAPSPPTDQPAAPAGNRRRMRFWTRFLNSDSSDSDDTDDTSSNELCSRRAAEEKKKKMEENVKTQMKDIMDKFVPKNQWNCVSEISKRQYGGPAKCMLPTLFSNKFYDSLYVPKRMKLFTKLSHHTGCVNALAFNESGTLLASGSDDLDIAIWDWYQKKAAFTYSSGHKDNIFQCKFMPLQGNTHIVSCARDGQVRLAELSSAGLKCTRKIAKHSKSAHKLALRAMCPYEVLSAGQDGTVYSIDIRQDNPEKLVLVKDVKGSKVPLYGIDSHPINQDQFCVAGQDEYVRVYDRRIISVFGPPVIKYCPTHLIDTKPRANITHAVYSNNGDALLASYNSDDIYLFDTSFSEGAEPTHRYSGHQNSSTVKGVNFLSPSSRYILSGSDCGNIFIWDRDTEAILNCMAGDNNGVVNVLEPHPHLPVMGTAGLDDEVKIWMPFSWKDPDLEDLDKTVQSNIRRRLNEFSADSLDTHMLRMIMDTIGGGSSFMRRRRAPQRQGNPPPDEDELELASSDSSDSGTSENEEEYPRGVQCTTQ